MPPPGTEQVLARFESLLFSDVHSATLVSGFQPKSHPQPLLSLIPMKWKVQPSSPHGSVFQHRRSARFSSARQSVSGDAQLDPGPPTSRTRHPRLRGNVTASLLPKGRSGPPSRASIHARTHTYTHMHMLQCTYIHSQTCIHMHTNKGMHKRVHTQRHTTTCMCPHTHVHTYTHICMHMQTCTHAHGHTFFSFPNR